MISLKSVVISNKVYSMDIHLYSNHIFINHFQITSKYRGRKYSYRIFESISHRYQKCIMLECFKTLLSYYQKLGFSISEQEDSQGYYIMVKMYKEQESEI